MKKKTNSLKTIETLCEHLADAADAYEELQARAGKRKRDADPEKWRQAIRDTGVMAELT